MDSFSEVELTRHKISALHDFDSHEDLYSSSLNASFTTRSLSPFSVLPSPESEIIMKKTRIPLRHERQGQSPTPRPPASSNTSQTPSKVSSQVPSTDNQGALLSLEPQRLVSATAIQEVLFPCQALQGVKIYDHTIFNALQSEEPQATMRALSTSIKTIIIPIHHPEVSHWTLVWVDRQRKKLAYYDSLRSRTLRTFLWPTFIPHLLKRLGLDPNSQGWDYESCGAGDQQNGYDCGIHILLRAYCFITDTTPPQKYKCDFWRVLFAIIITGQQSLADVLFTRAGNFRKDLIGESFVLSTSSMDPALLSD